MRVDFYTKVILTIIAVCLLALTLRGAPLDAGTPRHSMTCTGELKANAWGGAEASIGGYKVDVTCD